MRETTRQVLLPHVALRRRARKSLPYILVALLGLIPQWQPLPSIGGLVLEPTLPIVLFALGALVVLVKVKIRPIALITDEPLIGVGSILALLVITLATIIHGSSTFSLNSMARMCAGLTLMWAFREVMPIFLRTDAPLQRHLGLIAMVLVVMLVFGPVYLNGGAPHTMILSAVTQGDSASLVFHVFRTAFRASGNDDALANLRHTLAATVCALVALSSAFPVTSKVQRLSALAAVGLVTVWVLLSISRSTWLALMLPLVFLLVLRIKRLVETGRGAGFLVVMTVCFIALLPRFDGFITDRLNSTASYEGRADSLAGSMEALNDRTLIGGSLDTQLVGVDSPHIMILTMWLGGGVLAGLGGIMIIFGVLRLIVRSTVRLWRYPEYSLLPRSPSAPTVFGLARAQLIISCLVLSRMMFGGGQTVHIAIWSILGIALGIDAYLSCAIRIDVARTNLRKFREIKR